MNPLAFFGECYVRWRHSKGFGIHSPFAYNIVTTVVKPGKYGYYASEKFDHKLSLNTSETAGERKKGRFILRLALFLQSRRLVTSGLNEQLVTILAEVSGLKTVKTESIRTAVFDKGDLVIIDGTEPSHEILNKAIESGATILSFSRDKKLKDFLETPLSRGLCLSDRHVTMLIPRPEMAYTFYKISLL